MRIGHNLLPERVETLERERITVATLYNVSFYGATLRRHTMIEFVVDETSIPMIQDE